MMRRRLVKLAWVGLTVAGVGCATTGKAVIEQYREVTPTRFEGAVAVVLEDKMFNQVSADGREVITEAFRRIKLLDRKAMDCSSADDSPNCRLERSFGYEPGFGEFEFVEARTITPEGEIFETKRDEMTDTTFTSWLFPDEQMRGLVYRAKGASPGAIIEERYRFRATKSQGLGGFTFQDRDPVLETSYTVNTPADYKYTWRTFNADVQPTEKTEGNRVIRTWTMRDIPPLVVEDDMIAVNDVIAKLAICDEKNFGYEDVSKNTDVGTWEKFGKFQVDLFKNYQDLTPELKEVVDKLSAGTKNDTDKVKAIWKYMNNNVRYVARKSSDKDRGILPLTPAFVCSSKYGDCKAVGNFISVIGRAMGLRADPVIIGTRNVFGNLEKEVPSHQFNHMIARVEADGKTYWLDATQRIMSFDTTPYADQGVDVMVLNPENPRLEFIPVQPPEQNQGTTKTVFVPGPDGQMLLEEDVATTGNIAGDWRGESYNRTDDKWKKLIERYVSAAYPQATVTEQSYSGKEDSDVPFVVKVKATIPKALQQAGSFLSFEVKDPFQHWTYQLFQPPKRRYGVDLVYLSQANHRFEVGIPAKMKPVALPKNVTFEDDFVKVERLSQIENDRVVTHFSVAFKMLVIPPERYAKARESVQKAMDANSFVLAFEPINKNS